MWNERKGYRRGTRLSFNKRGRITRNRATFPVKLGSRETWKLCVDIVPIVDRKPRAPMIRCESFHEHAPKMRMGLDAWLDTSPELITDHASLRRTYRLSLLDLAALRIRPDAVTIKWAMLGGGLPWFMTVFGRDSIVAAYQALPFQSARRTTRSSTTTEPCGRTTTPSRPKGCGATGTGPKPHACARR